MKRHAGDNQPALGPGSGSTVAFHAFQAALRRAASSGPSREQVGSLACILEDIEQELCAEQRCGQATLGDDLRRRFSDGSRVSLVVSQ
jgi:hypothetical protein